jgi:hypothetical protein
VIGVIYELKSSAEPSTLSQFRKAFSYMRLKALCRLLLIRGSVESEARLSL